MPSSNVDARCGVPALAKMAGQRFAGGNAQPQAIGAGAVGHILVRQKRGIERRYAVKNRRPMPAHDVEHRFGRRPLRQQHGGGADRQRKRHGVAHAVGEKQFCGGEHHVVLADTDHALSHQPRRRHRRGMDVLDSFGIAGRTGRVHPERDFVGQRRRGEKLWLPARQKVGEIMHVAAAELSFVVGVGAEPG